MNKHYIFSLLCFIAAAFCLFIMAYARAQIIKNNIDELKKSGVLMPDENKNLNQADSGSRE